MSTNEPQNMKCNEFWGKRSGTIHPKMGFVFKGSRGSTTCSENRGPTGWKARRAPRNYRNRRIKGL